MTIYRGYWRQIDWDLVYTGANCTMDSGFVYGKTKEEVKSKIPAHADKEVTQIDKIKVSKLKYLQLMENED